jgi:hypothetical protein
MFSSILSFVAFGGSGGNLSTGNGLLGLLVQLVIVGLIIWLCLWFVSWVGIPEPFNKVIKVIIGLVCLVYLINVLLGIGGGHV